MTAKTRQYVYAKSNQTLDIRTLDKCPEECVRKATALNLTGGFARGLLLREFTSEELDQRKPMLLPPASYLGYAHTHWVESDLFGGGLELWQWQPGAQLWCRPNQYACGLDFDLKGYRWQGLCPPLPSSDEYESVAALIRRKMEEAAGSDGAPKDVILSHAEIREISSIFFDSMSRPVKPLKTSDD